MRVDVVTRVALAAALATVAAACSGDDGRNAAPTTSTRATVTTTSTTTTTTTTTLPTTTTTTTRRVTTTVPRPPTTSTSTPTPAAPATAIRRGNPSRAVVALTFDAGSDAGYTSAILDTLAANGIDATFGITGRFAEANRTLVKRIATEGHQIVNHSYDHPSFTGGYGGPVLTRAQRLDQLARAEAAVQAAAGVTTKPWFRPPYGAEDASVRSDIAVAGYRYELMWTVDSLGWKGVPADEVVNRCVNGAVPGAIFLMHVGGASTDFAGLQRVIDGLRAKGYGFATAAALIA